jgi:hypothetical protein
MIGELEMPRHADRELRLYATLAVFLLSAVWLVGTIRFAEVAQATQAPQ